MKAFKAILLFTLITHFAAATHMQGSEIHATHLSGNEYKIDIISHYSIISTLPFNPEPFQILKIYQRANGINLVKIDSLPFHRIDTSFTSTCSPSPYFDLIFTYSDTLVFDSTNFSSSGGYLLVFSILGTTNYSNSTQTVREIYSLIPPSYDSGIQIDNSSPIPNNLLNRPVICTNEEFRMDLSATDADGDSLSYRFFTPASNGAPAPGMMNVYSAPYDYPPTQFNQIQWVNGFSELNQINGASPNTQSNQLKLDSITGEMTVKAASQTGRFLVAVAVEEFRDLDNDGFKELMGAVYRVLSFEVDNCTWKINDPPQLNIAIAPSNFTYSCNTASPPGSNIFNVCVDTLNEFILTITDNNPQSAYIFEVDGLNASIRDSVAYLTNANDTIQNSVYLSAGIADIGSLKEIKVIVTDTSECRNTIRDTLVFYINPQMISGLENSLSHEVNIYPNPTSGFILINGLPEDTTQVIKIYNTQLKLVDKRVLDKGSLNLEELNNGLYYLRIDDQMKKVIIQK